MFQVNVGVRQVCVMSPELFNLYVDGVMDSYLVVAGSFQYMKLSLPHYIFCIFLHIPHYVQKSVAVSETVVL